MSVSWEWFKSLNKKGLNSCEQKTAKQEESMMEWQSISENTCNHSSCVLETYSYKTVSASLRNYNKSLVQSTLMIQKNWR